MLSQSKVYSTCIRYTPQVVFDFLKVDSDAALLPSCPISFPLILATSSSHPRYVIANLITQRGILPILVTHTVPRYMLPNSLTCCQLSLFTPLTKPPRNMLPHLVSYTVHVTRTRIPTMHTTPSSYTSRYILNPFVSPTICIV